MVGLYLNDGRFIDRVVDKRLLEIHPAERMYICTLRTPCCYITKGHSLNFLSPLASLLG